MAVEYFIIPGPPPRMPVTINSGPLQESLVDEADSSTTYIGYASTGTTTSQALWQIKKISISGTVTTIAWANGNADFKNVWDNRVSLSYS